MSVMDGAQKSFALPVVAHQQTGVFRPAKKRHRPHIVAGVVASCVVVSAAAVLLPVHIINASVVPQAPQAVIPVPAEPAFAGFIDKFAKTQPVPFGIYVEDLKTGAKSSSLGNRQFTGASIYKLYVALGILKRVEAGKLSLGSKTTGQVTVGQCLNAMITTSNNSCGHSLGTMLGWENYDAELSSLGFGSTSLGGTPVTTANDVGLFYRKLYQGTLLGPTGSKLLLGFLKQQQIVNRLPQGLPTGTAIAHKTGDLNGYMHDAGIVYGPKTDYIIVALSGPWKNTYQSHPSFADLSAKLYKALNP